MAKLSTAKVPPTWVVRTVEGVRARLQRLSRRMVPAPIALLELSMGSMLTQAIYVAAELRVAEALRDGPRSPAEIAQMVDAHPEALHRLLRLLASYKIFAERKDGRFALTPMADALRADSPNSMRGIAVLMGHPIHWEDWSYLVDSVRTGDPSLPKLRGMGAYEYLAANPDYGAVFFGGMGNLSSLETVPILAAYDFSRYGTIVDVGGGGGALLAAILQRARKSRGVLFDSRAVASGAEAVLAEAGVADRCTIEDGDLLDPVTPGGDAYILKHIVHDWPEAKVQEILRNVRKAIGPDGRLLLMEFVTPQDGREHPAKLVDLWLMLLVGGKERTATQYTELLASTGFELTRVVPTVSALAIVEARPV
jgi:SAM-dependent methyltransferase